jgi:NADPH:quinone reductase-like Zn-dependent oxidoreductase/acyl carrier protein
VILNSLSGEAVERNLSILAPYGRLVEIGKRDIFSDRKLSLYDFRRSLSYMTFDLSHITHDRPIDCNRALAELLSFLEQGKLKPLPFRVFPIGAAAQAYRYMARARHVGKIVLSFREPAVPVVLGPERRVELRRDATYLVSGGTTGLGLAAARWLAERGGGRIVLLSRKGIRSEVDRAAIEKLRDLGSEPVVVLGDVTKEDCLRAIRVDSEQVGRPLRGVIHAAMILDDALIENLTPERIEAVMAPKISGAWLLHTVTRDLPLDLFVLFSSFASIIGSPGQAGYAAANAFIDSLAHYRKACGLPALTINFGAVADVGYLSTHEHVQKVLRQQGIRAMRSSALLAMLDGLLVASPCQVVAADPDWATIAASFPAARSPRFGRVTKGATSERDRVGKADEVGIVEADSVEALLREEIAKVLGARPATIDAERPLVDSGLDSLMAVELRNQIRERCGVDVPILILMKDASLKTLIEYIVERQSLGIPDRPHPRGENTGSGPYLGKSSLQDQLGRSLPREEFGGFQDATQLLNQLDELSEQELDAALIAIESQHAREESQE